MWINPINPYQQQYYTRPSTTITEEVFEYDAKGNVVKRTVKTTTTPYEYAQWTYSPRVVSSSAANTDGTPYNK